MKKQLLAAAVAATMTSVAMADISITGAAKVNFTSVDTAGTEGSTETISKEMDLAVVGKSGDTSVVMKFGNDVIGNTGLNTEDSYLTTKVGDMNIKAGAWDNGNNALRASGRTDGHLAVSTSMGGIGITYDTYGDAGDDTVKVSADLSGVAVSFKQLPTGEDITLATEVGGVKVSYLALNRDVANTDRSVVEASGSFGGMNVKVAQANADSGVSIEGDTWMGDFEGATGSYDLTNGQDVTSIEVSTAMAGNTVAVRNSKIDDVNATDTSITKFIVTRALTSGATFEMTYASISDDDTNQADTDTLDLELAVKF